MEKKNKRQTAEPSLRKKTFLVLGFFCLTAFFVSIAYTVTKTPKAVVVPPDYSKVLKLGIDNFEEAENALIYHDVSKAQLLLEKSERYTRMALPSPELGSDAQKLLEKISIKRMDVEKELAGDKNKKN